jgi:hypothetical protein
VEFKAWTEIVDYLLYQEFPKTNMNRDTKKNFEKKYNKFEYNKEKNKLFYKGTKKVCTLCIYFTFILFY